MAPHPRFPLSTHFLSPKSPWCSGVAVSAEQSADSLTQTGQEEDSAVSNASEEGTVNLVVSLQISKEDKL